MILKFKIIKYYLRHL